ncbi:hypothetical protein LIER_33151 [Lithospermum erythrorhizon]|uniref:Uncharacterized protein n=1 Tax=Lithospermum erythrorhizon TaxID=34254 RepID=A0AAV3RVW4_LITER
MHTLACSLQSVGKTISEEDLIRQLLLGLHLPYHTFVTLMSDTRPYTSFSTLSPMLLSEKDRVKRLMGNGEIGIPQSAFISQNKHHQKGGTSSHTKRKMKPYKSQNSYSNHYTSHPSKPFSGDGILGSPPKSYSRKQQCQICEHYNHNAK